MCIRDRKITPERDLFNLIRIIADRATAAILSIPVPVESDIHEAMTPFSTYRLIHDVCATARQQVVWIDRFFDRTVFHRFLADVPTTAMVTLVTWPDSKCRGAGDNRRYVEFMDISRLFATERGSGQYRLVTNEEIHSRLLRVDNTLLHLGDSSKELGKGLTFTISKLDATESNRNEFDKLATDGTELFGPTNPNHP